MSGLAIGSLHNIVCIAGAQETSLVSTMVRKEVAARGQEARFSYVSTERSPRTQGQLWTENVVETDDGPVRRLTAINGTPLSAAKADAEEKRIEDIVRDPGAFRRENTTHKDDEAHATQLLELLPRAFLIVPAGEINGCASFNFKPNPAFQPSGYEERLIHAMGGTVSIQESAQRLCQLHATILSPVEFGFGLLGRVDPDGSFLVERAAVDAQNWKSTHMSVHVQGRVLMLKSLTREQETVRRQIRVLPSHLSLRDAANLTQPRANGAAPGD